MKRVVYTLFFTLIAQAALTLDFEASLEGSCDLTNDFNALRIDVEANQVIIEDFGASAYGGIELMSTRIMSKLSFQPQFLVYKLGLLLRYGIVAVGWEHACIHPGDFRDKVIYDYQDLFIQRYDRIYFRISTEKDSR